MIMSMGDKATAKAMKSAGVKVIPGGMDIR